MSKVVLTPCADYTEPEVERALTEVLAPLGGLDWVTEGMKIGIKANLVTFMKPEQAATTHPALLCALVKRLVARGAEVTVGDSPGGLYNAAYVGRVYAATGMKQVEAAGAKLNRNFESVNGRNEAAKIAKNFTYTAWLDEMDAIINFSKLKSHGMMSLSAATKNLFGTIPGTMKPEYHFKYPNEADFADMLVDLNLYFKPRLCIVDAVIGMEGNGPTAGTPRALGSLIASENPFSTDMICAEIVGLSASDVPTLIAAQARELCPKTVGEIELIGDLNRARVPDFKRILHHHSLRFQGNGKGLARCYGLFLEKLLTSKPMLERDKCVGCGVCARTCPAKAIDMTGGKPKIDRKACIRCFCCQEFCPKGAMIVHRPPIARLLNRDAR